MAVRHPNSLKERAEASNAVLPAPRKEGLGEGTGGRSSCDGGVSCSACARTCALSSTGHRYACVYCVCVWVCELCVHVYQVCASWMLMYVFIAIAAVARRHDHFVDPVLEFFEQVLLSLFFKVRSAAVHLVF